MSYDNYGGLVCSIVDCEILYGLFDHMLTVGIQSWCCFIKNDHFWVSKESSGYWNPLLLASTELTAPLTNFRKKFHWETFWVTEELHTTCSLGSINDFLVGELLQTIGNVIFNTSWKKSCFLINKAYLSSDGMSAQAVLVLSSKSDCSRFDSIKLLDELDNGWLSWATFADKGDILSFIDCEGEISKSQGAWERVLKSYIFELYCSWDVSFFPLFLVHQRLIFEHFKDFLNSIGSIDDVGVAVGNCRWRGS